MFKEIRPAKFRNIVWLDLKTQYEWEEYVKEVNDEIAKANFGLLREDKPSNVIIMELISFVLNDSEVRKSFKEHVAIKYKHLLPAEGKVVCKVCGGICVAPTGTIGVCEICGSQGELYKVVKPECSKGED